MTVELVAEGRVDDVDDVDEREGSEGIKELDNSDSLGTVVVASEVTDDVVGEVLVLEAGDDGDSRIGGSDGWVGSLGTHGGEGASFVATGSSGDAC